MKAQLGRRAPHDCGCKATMGSVKLKRASGLLVAESQVRQEHERFGICGTSRFGICETSRDGNKLRVTSDELSTRTGTNNSQKYSIQRLCLELPILNVWSYLYQTYTRQQTFENVCELPVYI